MRKKCSSCGAPFKLSGSGTRQKYCSECAKQGVGKVQGFRGSNPLKTKGAGEHFSTPIPPAEIGQFVRLQIEAQKDRPNPITFTTPDGHKGRVWLAGDAIGDDRHWRMHVSEAMKLAGPECGFSEPRKATADIIRLEGSSHVPLTRLKANPPARDPDCVQADTWRPRGYRVRLCIYAEKELQVLGCGWRIVTIELDGSKVHLRHSGNVATMKRKAFKELLAANRRLRRKRPVLRLVVSNPPRDTTKEFAA